MTRQRLDTHQQTTRTVSAARRGAVNSLVRCLINVHCTGERLPFINNEDGY